MRASGVHNRADVGHKVESVVAGGDRPRLAVVRLASVRFVTLLLLLSLTVQPALAANRVVFAVVGDMGTGGRAQYAVAEQMKTQWRQRRFEFIITVGDNIYPDGNPALLRPRFEEPYKPLLDAGVKFYASLGNHDVQRGGAREAQINYQHFNMRGRSYYSFEKGRSFWDKLTGGEAMAEFFALDSTRMNETQVAWLERELSKSKARWKVVYMHHPIYSSGGKHGSNMRLRRLLEPVFVRHGVDVVFAGHDHFYERTRPQQGIVHFVAGAGGQLRKRNINRNTEFFEAGNDEVHSFLIVTLADQEIKVEAVGADGRMLDQASIGKQKVTNAAAGER